MISVQANTYLFDLGNLEIERTTPKMTRLEKFENTIDKLFKRLPTYPKHHRIYKKEAFVRKTKSSKF